jgi:hypothetical protein
MYVVKKIKAIELNPKRVINYKAHNIVFNKTYYGLYNYIIFVLLSKIMELK